MGDHAVFYTVCGCPSVVFSKLSSDCVLVWRCLTFLISLEADFQGPFKKRHDYVRTVTTKSHIGHHGLQAMAINLMLTALQQILLQCVPREAAQITAKLAWQEITERLKTVAFPLSPLFLHQIILSLSVWLKCAFVLANLRVIRL